MLGEEELIKLFPEFKDTIQPSGIDLRVDKVFKQTSEGSLIDDVKNLPEIEELQCDEDDVYTLKSKCAYSVTIEGKIQIPVGYTMLYLPRSTLLRSFISVHTAVGDPGFYGTLQFMVVNNGEYDYKLKKGERIAQAVVFKVDGSGQYSGSYQEKR
ncbi:MAG: deoxyuridine 5'-triphosphate nucleotidohydrolase [Methanosphaera sp.]|uniref:dCTP deaminase domain-containing protein n=1 Tax=Methanosphaera sp. TaxID=2666342 RepID=UPI0025D16ED1|nr:deoxyuridine 5'-triphosphate nucleotidohydrolase [Methanosphaera sp.]MCI5867859.1 deoxyuridine 5'-triphosphate nucleotidohydrolase [Methanosphaera sp.]MDD6534869.1 deoxyuridine 5'-triphosphate nucleotidohydrolase [Methanosphaera sp.]MDY3955329.1 deoxyuridine 5'-triphosphate nucleotidohydrolase [Methanosphaera sp.]